MNPRWVLAISALVGIVAAYRPAQTPGPHSPRTYANPIDIDYRYNFEQKNQGISYRSGADPAIESFDENGVSTLSAAVPIR